MKLGLFIDLATMNAMGALLFRLSWHFLFVGWRIRGTGIHDLHRVRSHLRQRFTIEEPRWVAPYQRPKKMLAGLPSNSVYPPDTFPGAIASCAHGAAHEGCLSSAGAAIRLGIAAAGASTAPGPRETCFGPIGDSERSIAWQCSMTDISSR